LCVIYRIAVILYSNCCYLAVAIDIMIRFLIVEICCITEGSFCTTELYFLTVTYWSLANAEYKIKIVLLCSCD